MSQCELWICEQQQINYIVSTVARSRERWGRRGNFLVRLNANPITSHQHCSLLFLAAVNIPNFPSPMLEQSHRTCSIRLRDSGEASRKIWRRVGWHRRPTDENTTECHVDFDSELDSDAQEIVRICIFLFFASSRSRRCLSSLVFVLCENWKRIQSKSSR